MHCLHLFLATALSGASPLLAQTGGHVDASGAPAPAPVSQATIMDDLRVVTPARDSLVLLEAQRSAGHFTSTGPESPGSVARHHGTHVKAGDPSAATGGMSVRRMLTQPLYQEADQEGRIWTRVRDMKASFGPDGFTVYPVFGRTAMGNYDVAFGLSSVTVGGAEIGRSPAAQVSRSGHLVTIDHGTLRETYHVSLDEIEQTFVFQNLPAKGDLVVRLGVDTEMASIVDSDGIHFVDETFGSVTYGDAFVVDAAGRREAISRIWTGDSIELTVPASFLAGATFPVTIDPPVTSFTSTNGTADDANPDICYAGAENIYWVAWDDYVSGTQRDLYAANFDTTGASPNFISVEIGADDSTDPKIAYHYNSNTCLVVSSEVASTSGFGTIQGQRIDCATGTTTGAQFTISSTGALKVHPDVGGNNWDNASNAYFCVVWSAVWTPGTYHQVQYRIVDFDGTLVTGLMNMTPTSTVHNQPALSETHGDGDLFGDWWTAAWIEDADNDGFGSVQAQRIVWNGAVLGAGSFTVASGLNCANPSVTSRFNRDLLNISDRPSIVAYEKTFPDPVYGNAEQRSIYTTVVTDGVADVESQVSWQLEDFDLDLDQRNASIACDGNCFYLIYDEVYYGNPTGTDTDMYMLSGCLTDRGNGAEIALAERHQNMSFSASAELNGVVATIWDGEENSISDDGMAIWEDRSATNGAVLEGYTLEIPTTNQSTSRAVGRQFCDANPNSGGGQQGRQSTWSWIRGNQSVASNHAVICLDMPDNTFGYCLVANSTINVNMPAGSLGRICVGGAGRYVNQIGNSGTSGTITTTVNPSSMPQPNGFVSAAPGETWYFQYWHRDVSGGAATSNFSTACRIEFTN